MFNKTGFQERPSAELAEHVAGQNHSCFLQYQLLVFAIWRSSSRIGTQEQELLSKRLVPHLPRRSAGLE